MSWVSGLLSGSSAVVSTLQGGEGRLFGEKRISVPLCVPPA